MLRPEDDQLRRPLVDHVGKYEQHLKAKERHADHIKTMMQRVRSTIASCGFTHMSNVSVPKVELFLSDLRTKQERSIATRNHYLRAANMFFNWMRRQRRISENPICEIESLNVKTDRRHARRPATVVEFEKLPIAASQGPILLGMTGPERVVLHIVATYTGGRRNELGSILARSFDFQQSPPVMRIEPKDSKRRDDDCIPLRPDLAALVEQYIFDKKLVCTDKPLFNITDKRTAQMLRKDLKRASISYRDDRDRVLDFHALRMTFISNLANAGVSPKAAQTLARHSDIRLTMHTYTSIELVEQATAVERLPAIPQLKSPIAARGIQLVSQVAK